MNKMVEIASLTTEGLQTRDGLAKAVIKDYAEAIKAGKKLPPVTVIQDSTTGQLYLADGYHRKEAAILAGLSMMDAEVVEGTFIDAVRLAIKANAAHGLRRTKADKKNALQLAWDHRQELFGGAPTVEILADACSVSRSTVKRFYKVIQKGSNEPLLERVCKDGRKYHCQPSAAQAGESSTTDRYGAEVPEKIARAFGSSELSDIIGALRKLKGNMEGKIKAEDYAYCKISQSTLITLGNLIEDLKAETPWCVCRQCGGRGCYACGNTGVQTEMEYERNPKELRPDA